MVATWISLVVFTSDIQPTSLFVNPARLPMQTPDFLNNLCKRLHVYPSVIIVKNYPTVFIIDKPSLAALLAAYT